MKNRHRWIKLATNNLSIISSLAIKSRQQTFILKLTISAPFTLYITCSSAESLLSKQSLVEEIFDTYLIWFEAAYMCCEKSNEINTFPPEHSFHQEHSSHRQRCWNPLLYYQRWCCSPSHRMEKELFRNIGLHRGNRWILRASTSHQLCQHISDDFFFIFSLS